MTSPTHPPDATGRDDGAVLGNRILWLGQPPRDADNAGQVCADVRAAIARRDQTIASLQAEVGRLREALMPFARAHAVKRGMATASIFAITDKDFERAAAALSTEEKR